MYHYVRPIKGSKYPNIKGLELDGFCRQLDFFQRNFKIISAEEVIRSFKEKRNLSEDSLWLTFDDGYKDHIDYVFPELRKRKIQGTFFPPAKPIAEKSYLDVNAIHYILSSAKKGVDLIRVLESECNKLGINRLNFKEYLETVDSKSRYDNKEIKYDDSHNFEENMMNLMREQMRKDLERLKLMTR